MKAFAKQNYLRQLKELGGNLIYLSELEVVNVSSSDLRKNCAGEDPEVMMEKGSKACSGKYIRENNLVEIWSNSIRKRCQVINGEIFMQDQLKCR